MVKIERLEPYLNKKDKEITPHFNFVKDNVLILDSTFPCCDEILETSQEDCPYEYMKKTILYGTEEKGISVEHIEKYEQVAYEINADIVNVSVYGLDKGQELLLSCVRYNGNQKYLELKVNGLEESSNKIVENFYQIFQTNVINEQILAKELLILKSLIIRRSWTVVELRASKILANFPKQKDALLALALAKAAQNDIETGEEILKQILRDDPRNHYALLNLGAIYEEKNDFNQALKILQKANSLDPRNHTINWLLGTACEKLGLFDEAIEAYHNAIRFSPNPNDLAFKVKNFTAEAKEAIQRLLEEKK